MTGVEWNRFFADPEIWGNREARNPHGKDTYCEDGMIAVDGDEEAELLPVPDTAVVTVDGGDIYNAAPHIPSDLEDCIEWWRSRQANVEMQVTVPRERQAEVQAALKSLGLEARIVA